MAHNPAIDLASAIQSASINRAPSPHHDINPSTAASTRIPVDVHPISDSIDEDDVEDIDHASLSSGIVSPSRATTSSSTAILTPHPRSSRPGQRGPHPTFPPLPDFRFEQSYLASISRATTNKEIAYITFRDQVLLPLVQGTIWTLVLSGWRFWNRGAKFSGRSLGSKIRRWWWGVNGWKVPDSADANSTIGGMSSGKYFGEKDVSEFYINQFSSSQGD